MADGESPLIKALPPESDYYTYLTIVEYHLSQENLPILHKVLQDETLTTNIGWDLVHLLVPYLPESEPCLHDIARLGNPREVILKVTESLRLIEYEKSDDEDNDAASTDGGASDARVRADSSTYPLKTAAVPEGQDSGSSQAVELPPPLPVAVSQFISLLSMLAILHGRIRTQKPSRFLSTTLQAILASFSNSLDHREEMIRAIVTTVKTIAGTKRPTLPTRQSSGMLSSARLSKSSTANADDPEASESTEYSVEEKSMQNRLLQSFLTHVIEEYMLNLPSTQDEVPGMAWCSRIMERLHADRVVPKTPTFGDRFANEEQLQRRIDALGQMATLSQDLKLTNEELLHAAVSEEKMPERDGLEEDDPPESADEIPLSRLGSLMLYTVRQVSTVLYELAKPDDQTPFAIFPHHHELVKNCLSAPNFGSGSLGTEPEALIDAIVALGLVTLERESLGEPESDELYNEYLQTMALLSSNCPSPNLRGHAHYLTTTILRSHPDDELRLAFIKDTLEHCPFENLKVSAVGWIKGETMEANPPNGGQQDQAGETSIFAKPLALESLSPHLFPSLQADLLSAPIQDAWLTFRTNFSYYLASLNFLYLLLCAKHLHETLMVQDLWTNNDVAASFVQPLREAGKRFRAEMKGGGELSEERSDEALAEMNVLDDALGRVEGSVRFLNE